ncbi:sialidase family protein [Vineibacter terrae]|uniref:WD40/YVTN/BNR-like repeat-containing protein n=1 Tax=Vineibacter terrae TaxID=2586908 RepID=UPI002E31BDE8|nr:sialidase family protein [Vineibacter terrae]HEX2888001.1 sialidase family protein [Vineibacter terrae]
MMFLLSGSVSAHDASSYGGVFRSRDLGAAWLNADVGMFLNAALVIAVDPRDSSRLLVGTDLGVLGSRNAGRSWVPEGRDVIIGAVFALAFSSDGKLAMCAAASGVFRRDQDGWRRAEVPASAIPARALVAGPADGRFYLLGRSRLFVSDDGGRTFSAVPGLPPASEMTAVVAIAGSADILAAVIDGRAMVSHDGGRTWRDAGVGGADAPLDTIGSDAARPQRLWAAAGGRIMVSDDLGAAWRAAGRPLPEAGARVRGIAASADAATLVVSSDRGIYRSQDGGETWMPKEDNLPTHIEAGPLARDPNDAAVIYAVFSLMPYAEAWRMAVEGENLLARIEPISLVGGLSFLVLVLIGGGLAAQHLARRRAAAGS